MGQLIAAMDAVWRVLLVGLVLGAGLPTLFALGIRVLAWGTGGEAEEHINGEIPSPHPLGRIFGYTIFGIVVLCILGSIAIIIASGLGFHLAFTPFPTFSK